MKYQELTATLNWSKKQKTKKEIILEEKKKSPGEIIDEIVPFLLRKCGGQPIIQEDFTSQEHLKYICLSVYISYSKWMSLFDTYWGKN